MKIKQITRTSVIVFTLFSLSVFAKEKSQQSIKVMSLNVENLFDSHDDPNYDDKEFTPTGRQKWTDQVIMDKVDNLGEIINDQNADVIGINEIENQAMLEYLIERGTADGRFVSAVSANTNDGRGIRTALISKFPVIHSKSHPVGWDHWRDEGGKLVKTRDILEVTLNLDSVKNGMRMTVFVNHWPSRRGGEPREEMRKEAAQYLSKLTKAAQRIRPNATVIALGDFNDEFHNRSFQEGFDMFSELNQLIRGRMGAFYPMNQTLAHLPANKRGTYYYFPKRQWNELDNIMLARYGKNPDLRLEYTPNSFEVVRHRFATSKAGIPIGCELRDRRWAGKTDERCLYGASDHLPIAMKLNVAR